MAAREAAAGPAPGRSGSARQALWEPQRADGSPCFPCLQGPRDASTGASDLHFAPKEGPGSKLQGAGGSASPGRARVGLCCAYGRSSLGVY